MRGDPNAQTWDRTGPQGPIYTIAYQSGFARIAGSFCRRINRLRCAKSIQPLGRCTAAPVRASGPDPAPDQPAALRLALRGPGQPCACPAPAHIEMLDKGAHRIGLGSERTGRGRGFLNHGGVLLGRPIDVRHDGIDLHDRG